MVVRNKSLVKGDKIGCQEDKRSKVVIMQCKIVEGVGMQDKNQIMQVDGHGEVDLRELDSIVEDDAILIDSEDEEMPGLEEEVLLDDDIILVTDEDTDEVNTSSNIDPSEIMIDYTTLSTFLFEDENVVMVVMILRSSESK